MKHVKPFTNETYQFNEEGDKYREYAKMFLSYWLDNVDNSLQPNNPVTEFVKINKLDEQPDWDKNKKYFAKEIITNINYLELIKHELTNEIFNINQKPKPFDPGIEPPFSNM